MSKITFRDCPSCKTEKCIQVEVSKPTEKGFTVTVMNCPNCKKQHTIADDGFSLVEFKKESEDGTK